MQRGARPLPAGLAEPRIGTLKSSAGALWLLADGLVFACGALS
jgi:hypothetical protein